MTKLLEEAIAKVRELSAEEQDFAAQVLMRVTFTAPESVEIDAETLVAVNEGLAQMRRGEFATDEEIAAIWKRHGL